MHLTLMAKERSKLQRRIDAFTRVLFLDENGKPKSATFLYSFLLAILFAAVSFVNTYTATRALVLGPLAYTCVIAQASKTQMCIFGELKQCCRN